MGLAGVKRKQRISLDPQNKAWKDDKDKFGYKMLLKMGWEEGKGLGKDEDGSTVHLNVEFKSDTVGLGVEKTDTVKETYQQLTAFDDILRRVDRQAGVVVGTATFSDQGGVNTNKRIDRNSQDKRSSKIKEATDGCKPGRENKRKRSAEASTSRGGEKDTTDDENSATTSSSSPLVRGVVAGRLAHRQKFIRNKRVDQYSAKHLKEILGIEPDNK